MGPTNCRMPEKLEVFSEKDHGIFFELITSLTVYHNSGFFGVESPGPNKGFNI